MLSRALLEQTADVRVLDRICCRTEILGTSCLFLLLLARDELAKIRQFL